MADKVHQVEFLLEGYLLPPTIGKLQVSETLILEQAFVGHSDPTGKSKSYTIAYVGIEGDSNRSHFSFAGEYLDFFLLIYSLTTGQPVIHFTGIGTAISDLSHLGK